jgi:RNA polymerase sigma-70 factor, ECF subfamily
MYPILTVLGLERMQEMTVTEMLNAAQRGNGEAWDTALRVLYGELRRISAAHMRLERSGHLLQPTALVHEAWLKLLKTPGLSIESRVHFLSTCSRLMRQLLVDHARRGSSAPFNANTGEAQADLGALHEALTDFEKLSPRQYRVVELRFFAGMTLEEIAAATNSSVRTVKRDWVAARAWLYNYLSGVKQ